MKKNVGNIDRIVRILLALVFGYLYFSNTVTGLVGTVLLVLGGIFVLTALVGTCPIYSALGMSTCPVKQKG
ncbi:MAG: DUF2892 domain-containing protein [Flavobacteriales bacterium]|nr:DUF2892 domain-containing protein [Flavobacteriales bacterium]MBK7941055.1 DUF2892 domain-containing protein [Flavobacteriales bacterium]MBK9701082.1 DUF2892 domain-containing protein [Flavobacteriales bacterium]